MPDMVQIGNEPTLGFLWPDGKLPDHWDQFADLVKAGIDGMDAGRAQAPRPRVLIQLDLGGDWKTSKLWWDKFLTYNIPFDPNLWADEPDPDEDDEDWDEDTS